MIRSANYKERTLTVPPNDVRTYDALGNTFGCLEATAIFHIKFGNEGSATQFRKGLKMRTDEAFERVTIVNRSDVPLTLTVFISMGDVDDARLVLPSKITVQNLAPNGWNVYHHEWSTGWFHIPENPNRTSIKIENINSTGFVWLYKNTTDINGSDRASKRITLGNGQHIDMATAAEIYCRGNYVGGGDVFEIRVTEFFHQ